MFRAHVRPSFRPSSHRVAWRTRCARRFRSRLSSLAEGGHVLLGLTEQLAETLAARRSSLIAAILLVVGEDAPKACHVFRNPLGGEHCRCPVEGVLQRSEQSQVLTYRRSRGSPAKKRTWPSRSIVAFTAAFSRAACASQELRTPVVGRVNRLKTPANTIMQKMLDQIYAFRSSGEANVRFGS
jgi:hypothetical protein